MTTLIKNAEGKILKAEGKLWDQNSVTDCDCPCLDNSFDCDTHTLTRVNMTCKSATGGAGKWGIEWSLENSYDGSTHTGSYIITFPELVASWSRNTSGDGGPYWNKTVDKINEFTENYENCVFTDGTGPTNPLYYTFVRASPAYSRPVELSFRQGSFTTEEKITTSADNYVHDVQATVFNRLSTAGSYTRYSERCRGFADCCSSDGLYPGIDFNPVASGYAFADGYGWKYLFGYTWDVEITAEHTPVFSMELKGTED